MPPDIRPQPPGDTFPEPNGLIHRILAVNDRGPRWVGRGFIGFLLGLLAARPLPGGFGARGRPGAGVTFPPGR